MVIANLISYILVLVGALNWGIFTGTESAGRA